MLSALSVCVKNKDVNAIDEERKEFTVLFRKASAICRAPSLPNLLLDILSVVSVCVKNKDVSVIDEERKKFTVLFRKASARHRIPSGLISSSSRVSEVSVYKRTRT
jgi:hypothetical protein